LKAYQLSKERREDIGEIMDPAKGAIVDEDQTTMHKLLAKKVFIASGAEFGGEEPGWFRIVFTYPKPYLEEGLKRMIEALS
jgi:bifunctional pyridoxal-dependent enzyme with beta-cystathionase and maltose regulon repressor activities